MTKSVAASALLLLPLLAACADETFRCGAIGQDVLVEVTKASASDNVGDCKVPPAFRLGALGCNTALTYSADRCVVMYELDCIGGVSIDMDVKQTSDDGITGTLVKVDENRKCELELGVTVKATPAPVVDAGAE